VQHEPARGAGDPGGDVDQAGAQGGCAGPGVQCAGQRAGGAGEVVRDRGADQPGVVRAEVSRGQVRERGVLQVGDDLLDDGVVTVGGFGFGVMVVLAPEAAGL
jgi:hypothetical protein